MIIFQDITPKATAAHYYSMKRNQQSPPIKEEEEGITPFNKAMTDYTKCQVEKHNNSNETMLFSDINVSRMNTEGNLQAFLDQHKHYSLREFNANELQCNHETAFSLLLPLNKNRGKTKANFCLLMLFSLLIDMIIGVVALSCYFNQLAYRSMSSIYQGDFQYKYIYHHYNELPID